MSRHSVVAALPSGLVPVGRGYFLRDPACVARELLGCVLTVQTPTGPAGGVIVETEAYLGADDPGSHAATRGVTARNSVMYGPAGTVYVYFTYGCHHMLNLVCCEEGIAGAVLVRAIEPSINVESMRVRRPGRSDTELCSGPGKLAAALGVDLSDNCTALGVGRVNVYDCERAVGLEVGTSGRIGLSAGHELELRYYIVGSQYVSRGHTRSLGARARDQQGGDAP